MGVEFVTYTDWISAISTIVIAIATIVYVVVTKLTLNKIASQVELNRLQVQESQRFSALSVQPFFSVANYLLELYPISDPECVEDWNEYMGNIAAKFSVINLGLGPAHNVHVFNFLLGTVYDEETKKENTYVLGLFLKDSSSIQVDSSKDIYCINDEVSNTFIALLTKNRNEVLKSLSILLCLVFQDISSQRHIQYFYIPTNPKNLAEAFNNKRKGAEEILKFLCEKAQEKGEYSIGIPFDTIKAITKAESSTIEEHPAFAKKVIGIDTFLYDSNIISLGLPYPTETEKRFDAIKSRFVLGSYPSKELAVKDILNDLTSPDKDGKSTSQD